MSLWPHSAELAVDLAAKVLEAVLAQAASA
jgi:hypothetical protein